MLLRSQPHVQYLFFIIGGENISQIAANPLLKRLKDTLTTICNSDPHCAQGQMHHHSCILTTQDEVHFADTSSTKGHKNQGPIFIDRSNAVSPQ